MDGINNIEKEKEKNEMNDELHISIYYSKGKDKRKIDFK